MEYAKSVDYIEMKNQERCKRVTNKNNVEISDSFAGSTIGGQLGYGYPSNPESIAGPTEEEIEKEIEAEMEGYIELPYDK